MAKHFVKIESYSDGCGKSFNNLMLEASHVKWKKQMQLSVTPVKMGDDGFYSQVIDFSDNPLTAGLVVASLPMPRKNQKRIDAAQADLNGMGEKIAQLWNERKFSDIKALFS